jgi:hypothetical protein
MSTRFRAAQVAFATAAFVAACFLPAATLAQAEKNDGLILDTEPPGLFLLYSGDVIGYIEPCG